MAKVLRIVSVERGYDPRDFTLIAFGGGGPLHACAVADDIGLTRIVVPSHPGVFSAYGLLAADVRDARARSVVAPADDTTWLRVLDVFAELTRAGEVALAEQAIPPPARAFIREVDVRYAGQSTELSVDECDSLAGAVEAFHRRHEQRYGFCTREEPVEIVTARVIAVGTTPKPHIAFEEVTGMRPPREDALLERRSVYDGTRAVGTPVYARASLRAGDAFEGPAVVEQYDATTYVAPGWSARIDAIANLGLERNR
jgi:N-methylhydantoinase A